MYKTGPSSKFLHCCLVYKVIDLHAMRNNRVYFLTFRENSSCPTTGHFLPNTETRNEVYKYLRFTSQRNLSTETIKMKKGNTNITTTIYSETIGKLTGKFFTQDCYNRPCKKTQLVN